MHTILSRFDATAPTIVQLDGETYAKIDRDYGIVEFWQGQQLGREDDYTGRLTATVELCHLAPVVNILALFQQPAAVWYMAGA